MRPKAGGEGTPEEWLRRAKGNLALAKQRKPKDAYWEDLCFEAEQAVEKAVKAVMRFHGIDFPKTHDIGETAGAPGSVRPEDSPGHLEGR
jgi:HEPN domain-containing protein